MEVMDNSMEKPTVLIVDDSPEDIALVREFLKDLYHVKIANNGKNALKAAAAGTPPDIILLDIMMPVMDGYETCRQLKANQTTRDIPVIFLTSKTEVEDEMKGFELGAVDYITKPISPPVVRARVQAHLKLKCVSDYLKDKTAFLEDEVNQRTQAITHAKKEWERTFDTVPDPIMLLDKDHRILRANRAMAEPFGKTCQELVGRHCYEVVHGTSAPPDVCPHSRLLFSLKEERSEFMEEGLGRFLDVRTTPLYHEDGQFRGSVHIIRDITERNRAEAELKASEENFRMVVDYSHDWEYWVTEDKQLKYVSPYCANITGYGPDEFRNDPGLMVAITHPDDRERLARHLADDDEAGGKNERLEFRILTKGGDERWIDHVCVRVHDRNGKPRGRRANNRDISERKRNEEQMTKQIEELGRWHAVTRSREGRVGELKREVNELLTRLGGNPKYETYVIEGE